MISRWPTAADRAHRCMYILRCFGFAARWAGAPASGAPRHAHDTTSLAGRERSSRARGAPLLGTVEEQPSSSGGSGTARGRGAPRGPKHEPMRGPRPRLTFRRGRHRTGREKPARTENTKRTRAGTGPVDIGRRVPLLRPRMEFEATACKLFFRRISLLILEAKYNRCLQSASCFNWYTRDFKATELPCLKNVLN